jgi:hypothetical protein
MARVIDSNLWAAPDHPGTGGVEVTPSEPVTPDAQPATSAECQTPATPPASLTDEQLRALTERFGPLDARRLPRKPPQA